jgi:threonine 3-dehydrogenase
VYLEEWHEPMICGIRWFSELVELCGGSDIFAEKSKKGVLGTQRIVSSEEVVKAAPDIMLASWCGKPVEVEKILGISVDGGFAEFAKVPAQVAWKVDVNKIRPEVAVLHEPFGNAVHAASKTDLKGKTVAIFGLGPIASFLVLIVRGLGAKTIIGVEPNEKGLEMGKKLGVDVLIPLLSKESQGEVKSYHHNQKVIDEIMKLTNGLGVDVSFEMAGFNDSVNNAIASVRRGGDVILFGLKTGDFVFEDYNKLIMKGITMHCVAGRQIWGTWEITKKLFEDKENQVAEKLFSVLLNGGHGTILPISEYSKEKFEDMMSEHPKFLIQF